LEAPTGKEGLSAAWRDAPDLVLFDPTFADLPDKEFIQKLRNDPRTSIIPLVALSSDPSPFRKQTCLTAGVDEYLVKSSQAILSVEETLSRIFSIKNPTDNTNKDSEKNGSPIVSLSAKGGTGTSLPLTNEIRRLRKVQGNFQIISATL
jgi:CheY-like chemotaxis protein